MKYLSLSLITILFFSENLYALVDYTPSAVRENSNNRAEIDISNLNLGDTLRIEDVNLADDLDIIGDSSMLIASVVAPAKQEETSDEDSLEVDETDDSSNDDSAEKSESDSE